MNIKNIITIAKKELKSYFNNPTAYIVVLAFLLLWEFLFFRNVFLIGEVSLSSLFGFLPWVFMIVVPALTMGSLAEEKSEGTLEFLLTHPISQIELILGKFFGIVSFLAISLLFIFPLAWSFAHFGNLDWGQVFGQYLASLLMSGVLVSLGIFISSIFSSQISAFLLGVVANFFLIIVGTEFFSNHFSLSLASFLEQLSVSNHFNSMARGVIDLRDLWYFISLIAVFLGFTYLNLIKNKFGNRKKVFRNYQTAMLLLVGIVILSNIIGAKIPGRLDLTQDKIYTLSHATKKIVSNLPDIVNISLYASDQLPAQLQPVERETKDILEDYRTVSNGKITVVTKNPSTDSEVASEAGAKGIGPVRFNVVSQEEFQVKDGYLGIAISYGGKDEIIPFVQNINDLEYQLSSLLQKLTVENKTKIGFVAGHGEKTLATDYRSIGEELKKQFEIVDIAAKSETPAETKTTAKKDAAATPLATPKTFSIPDGVKALIIASPTEDYSDGEKNILADFINKGGSVMFLMDGATISQQTMSATASKNNLMEFLKTQTGVSVNSDLVYDLRSNESVTLGNGQMRYVVPYPFWLHALKVQNSSPITSKIDALTMPWVSSLSVNEAVLADKGYEKTDLFATSENAGVQTSSFNITPDQKFAQSGLGKKIVALALSSEKNSSRIVVVGDADFMSDQAAQNNSGNFGFGMEAISWLSQDSTLGQIRVKNLNDRKFVFANQSDPGLIKFGNLGFVFVLTAGYGSFRLWRRKKKKDEVYEF